MRGGLSGGRSRSTAEEHSTLWVRHSAELLVQCPKERKLIFFTQRTSERRPDQPVIYGRPNNSPGDGSR